MNDSIQTLLNDLETEHGIEILYACESGSRAWGFASPDSDYDIRFIYRRPFEQTYIVKTTADTIECTIENDLDPAGWDLKKTLGLLRKSNGALIEWLHSPIIYQANPEFHQQIQQLCRENFNQRELAGHYRGLARQFLERKLSQPNPSAKSYLYCLRATLAMRYVLSQNAIPPVPFEQLIPFAPDPVQTAIHDLIYWKSTVTENASPGHIDLLDTFLHDSMAENSQQLDQLTREELSPAPFNKLLHRWLQLPLCLTSHPTMRAADFTLERVTQPDLLAYECVSGSRSFGTEHENSDYDLRGVFIAPPSFLCGLETIDQVSDAKSDEVYYELKRFISLLQTNNPNLIELLFTPKSCIRHCHPAFDLIKPEIFLSKLCKQTFGNYAMGQIRKARGLNKKIINPEPEQRRPLSDFCHILLDQGTIPLDQWLSQQNITSEHCGLVALNHAPNTYAIYHDADHAHNYRGIFSPKDDTAILCSSVAKNATSIAFMHCNLDAFKAHCKAHREYWQWVKNRNQHRYSTNIEHGKGYDSKNLMHTIRLLDQAIEIATHHTITLPRPNADWLKQIKAGDFSYDELLEIAETKHQEMEAAYAVSTLPETPDSAAISKLIIEIRERFYNAVSR